MCGIIMNFNKSIILVMIFLWVSGCETDWDKNEISKSNEYSKEYGLAWVKAYQDSKFQLICLSGVEYWFSSRKMAVKFGDDGLVSKCQLDNLDSFKNYLVYDQEERIKWADFEK